MVQETCALFIQEYNAYSWKEGKDEPEDRNDHAVNAGQYSWLPYVKQIGRVKQ